MKFMKKDEEKDERFEITSSQEIMGDRFKIIVDKETGINYLYIRTTYTPPSCTVTPLLDSEGKPIVTKDKESL